MRKSSSHSGAVGVRAPEQHRAGRRGDRGKIFSPVHDCSSGKDPETARDRTNNAVSGHPGKVPMVGHSRNLTRLNRQCPMARRATLASIAQSAIRGVAVNGLVDAPMHRQVSLLVAIEVKRGHSQSAVSRRLEDGGAYDPPAPHSISRGSPTFSDTTLMRTSLCNPLSHQPHVRRDARYLRSGRKSHLICRPAQDPAPIRGRRNSSGHKPNQLRPT